MKNRKHVERPAARGTCCRASFLTTSSEKSCLSILILRLVEKATQISRERQGCHMQAAASVKLRSAPSYVTMRAFQLLLETVKFNHDNDRGRHLLAQHGCRSTSSWCECRVSTWRCQEVSASPASPRIANQTSQASLLKGLQRPDHQVRYPTVASTQSNRVYAVQFLCECVQGRMAGQTHALTSSDERKAN